MTRPAHPLLVGNWKMNGLAASLAEIDAIIAGMEGLGCDLMICPPATLLSRARDHVGEAPLMLGGQTCHPAGEGAHTGDISAPMLADAGAVAVIVGHSERRAAHGETNAQCRAQVNAAWKAGLMAILCVGETAGERAKGAAHACVAAQLEGSLPPGRNSAMAQRLAIAYEPVWAIGAGQAASAADIAEMHGTIREHLSAIGAGEGVRLLYGGSVRPENAAAILAIRNVEGALIGGASLKAADFLAIARACGQG